ncbi:hypothetical protein B0H14DRAFT_2612416 [Mycena olivaceomarginata]|nr:hypothetical protein B0H14DRAFT_2612416 [Mycena olivaceomarginata]
MTTPPADHAPGNRKVASAIAFVFGQGRVTDKYVQETLKSKRLPWDRHGPGSKENNEEAETYSEGKGQKWRGTEKQRMNNDIGRMKHRDVHYLTLNLISISRLDEEGYSVIFSKGKATFKTPEGLPFMEGHLVDGMYRVTDFKFLAENSYPQYWIAGTLQSESAVWHPSFNIDETQNHSFR